MGTLRITTLCLVVSFIQACSASPDASHAQRDAHADTPPPQKTVFDPLTGTLGRARSVQGTLDQSAERTRQAIDQEEHGDSAP